MKLLKRLFGKQTNYPAPVIPEKALTLINKIDNYLAEHSISIADSGIELVQFDITLRDQFKSSNGMLEQFKKLIIEEYYYIPRSVAFMIKPDGTWTFVVAIRRQQSYTSSIAIDLWLELLTRTNNARIE